MCDSHVRCYALTDAGAVLTQGRAYIAGACRLVWVVGTKQVRRLYQAAYEVKMSRASTPGAGFPGAPLAPGTEAPGASAWA